MVGLSRWASGLPFSVYEPGYSTNWEQGGMGVVTAPVKVKRHIVGRHSPGVCRGHRQRHQQRRQTTALRFACPTPGEAGMRNVFRGDGYLDIDSSLTKTWKLHEEMKLKFAAESL